MGEKSRYLGCDNLGPKEITLIKSMLRLFDGKTKGRWKFSEQPPYDALLVPDSRTANNDKNAETEHEALFIRANLPHSSDDNPQRRERRTSQEFVLRPIRPLILLQKLNHIGELLDSYDTRQLVLAQGWNDTREWIDILKELRSSHDNYMIETTVCKFAIFPLSRRFLCEKPNMPTAQLIKGRIRAYKKLDPLRAADILRIKKTASLDWLGWHAAIYGEYDQLLPDFKSDQPFRLRRWPDFGTLEHDPTFLPMAGLLSQRVLTLEELQKMSSFPTEKVNRFLNAALLAHYLEFVNEKPMSWLFGKRSENSAERLSLFGRIRNRLGL